MGKFLITLTQKIMIKRNNATKQRLDKNWALKICFASDQTLKFLNRSFINISTPAA